MNRKQYEEKTQQLILPLLDEMGLTLYDIDYEKEGTEYFLRVYIDKEGGVTIDDCVNVSRAFDEILDREDYIRDPYTFEVSSPGLDRPLKKDRDFVRSIGRRIELKTYRKVNGAKEFTGMLAAYSENIVTLIPEDAGTPDQKPLTFDRSQIASARLAFDYDF